MYIHYVCVYFTIQLAVIVPLADMTLRGAIDLNHNMICLSVSDGVDWGVLE